VEQTARSSKKAKYVGSSDADAWLLYRQKANQISAPNKRYVEEETGDTTLFLWLTTHH
jgi:hypothetical protein